MFAVVLGVVLTNNDPVPAPTPAVEEIVANSIAVVELVT